MFAEYVFPAFIFITSFLFFLTLLASIGRIGAILALILSGVFTVLSNKIAGSFSNPTLVLGAIYLIELIVLGGIVFMKNKEKEYSINIKVLSIFYFIVIFIGFLVSKGCYNDSKKSREYRLAQENKIRDYKSKYNFNVDSLASFITLSNEENAIKMKIPKPIILYRDDENQIKFDYVFNSELERSYKSFNHDSIKTIIVLKNESVQIGTYSNSKTKALRTDTKIYFIDSKDFKILRVLSLEGGEPPSKIEYRRSVPKSSSGYAPSKDRIIDAIKAEIY